MAVRDLPISVRSLVRFRVITILAGGMFCLFGFLNVVGAAMAFREGPDRFARGPNLAITDDAQRANHFNMLNAITVIAGTACIGIGVFIALGQRPAMIAGVVMTIFALMLRFYAGFVNNNPMEILVLGLSLIGVQFAFVVESLRLFAKVRTEREFAGLASDEADRQTPVERCIELLKHPKRSIRIESLHSLAEMGDEAAPAVPAIIEQLKTGDISPDSANICDMCGTKLTLWNRSLGSPRCGPCTHRVRAAANGADQWTLAEVAADTLGRLGPSASAAAPMLKKLSQCPNPLLADKCRAALSAIQRSRKSVSTRPVQQK